MGTLASLRMNILKRRILLGTFSVSIALCKAFAVLKEDNGENLTEVNRFSEKKLMDCIHPSVEEFPKDFLTPEERERGGIIVHLLIGLYMVISLCFVCDNYFVPVLEAPCKKLNISDDVAGATFMAAGTSSPELFTSIIGTFITTSDLGIGTMCIVNRQFLPNGTTIFTL